MVDAIRQAKRAHRSVVEMMYNGSCSIYEQHPKKNPITRVTYPEEIMVADKVPCHLSFSGSGPVEDGGNVAIVAQTMKLFLPPEIEVKPGSRIEVIQQERTENYGRSGKSAVYFSHQEIQLDLWRGYV